MIGAGGRSSSGGTTSGQSGSSANDGGAPANDGGASPAPHGGSSTAGTSTGVGGQSTAGTLGTAGTAATGTSACNNGKDDDGDGLIDGFDPECTGPADNDEGTYATGIPGDNRDPKWQDCFFDGNSGAGDDGCKYNTGCLTGDLPETASSCELTQGCIEFCRKLTPNGCDCFGCCTVQLENGTTLDIELSATCSLDKASDSTICPRCTKTTQCGNDCGECELCAGKTEADLPASCTPPPPPPPDEGDPPPPLPPPSYTCDNGEEVCGPNLAPCAASEYCSFGCCLPQIR